MLIAQLQSQVILPITNVNNINWWHRGVQLAKTKHQNKNKEPNSK